MSEEWELDEASGLWYKGADRSQPYASDWTPVPMGPEPVLEKARALAARVLVAGMTTISGEGFPRSRLVSPGEKYVAKDFSSVTVATRQRTRKVEDILTHGHSKVCLFWQDTQSDKQSAWLCAIGEASVAMSDVDDKATVTVTVQRLEMQDYGSHITANGHDSWKPAILERADGAWNRIC
ncbi:unnamed protein product [Symbiodinium natans]|uniref:Pyridoxamine 5'-phosphate oxidase putative domain-containing protein n=1 Tax=Symbiodinium natans TaxID=878477 RepID=A0A812S4C5_9DINO|nr:unnamed protein product [Symbiodinium natans]